MKKINIFNINHNCESQIQGKHYLISDLLKIGFLNY